jgi:UDP-glucose-4-epimerase GalE
MVAVLITGGAGYIGSHACKALAQAGHQPIAFDNLCRGVAEAVRWGPLETGDIRDGERLDAVFKTYRPEVVMHFAANTEVGASVADPAPFYANNVGGTLSLLDAIRRHGVRHVVLSSTCAIYGAPATLPIHEGTPAAPINPYGVTKLAAEHALRDYGSAYGIGWVALRYFNAAGADEDGHLGERHELATLAMPRAIRAALGLGPPFAIFGTDYPTPDGTCIRDFIHVDDLAEAHLLALDRLEPGKGLCHNLGIGRGYSVREVIQTVEAVTGKRVSVKEGPRRSGDPAALVASGEKIRRELGWQPRYAELRPIIETAWAWHRSHPRGYGD